MNFAYVSFFEGIAYIFTNGKNQMIRQQANSELKMGCLVRKCLVVKSCSEIGFLHKTGIKDFDKIYKGQGNVLKAIPKGKTRNKDEFSLSLHKIQIN